MWGSRWGWDAAASLDRQTAPPIPEGLDFPSEHQAAACLQTAVRVTGEGRTLMGGAAGGGHAYR